MKPSATGFSGLMQRWALGILLGLSISVAAVPELAIAKNHASEKSVTKKKSDKKAVRQKDKAKKTAKKVGKDTKKKTASKDSKKKLSGKSASKASGKDSKKKTASKDSKKKSSGKKDKKIAKQSGKSRSSAKQSSTRKGKDKSGKRKDQYVWMNSNTSGQGYFVMPGANGVGRQVAKQASASAVAPQSDNRNAQPGKASDNAYQVGTASYYGKAFEGKKTASGERFDQEDYTCAHGSLPFGCRLRVTNLRNNKSVEVKVNDRGGFQKHGRVIDLSKAAARDIGMLGSGTAKVQIEVLE